MTPEKNYYPNSDLYILHCDLDAFFAAVEQRDHPEWKGKPVIVGGDAHSRGVVSTCSYEAREYGVRSAMPAARARQLCPQGIFLPVNMSRYKEVSAQVFSLLADYTPQMEIISIDEAFLDIRGSGSLFGAPEEIAAQIKGRVQSELDLIISVGISYNKYLAKLASDLGKPDGLRIIRAQEAFEILRPLPVSRLWGIGEKTSGLMDRYGIYTIGDIQDLTPQWLQDRFGSSGLRFWQLAHGIDERPVEADYDRKSLGREITFPYDTADLTYFDKLIEVFAAELCRKLRQDKMEASAVTIKLRFADFKTITRSQTIPGCNSERIVASIAREMLGKTYQKEPLRLLGLSLGRLSPISKIEQGCLFDDDKQLGRDKKMEQIVDEIQSRFGSDAIKWANLLE